MCIHEVSSCADCPTPEAVAAKREADANALERAFARAMEVPDLPEPHPVRLVPVPTTSRHEPDHDIRVEWDPHRHRIGTNTNPSFVPIELPGDVEVLFARLADAHPDWVR